MAIQCWPLGKTSFLIWHGKIQSHQTFIKQRIFVEIKSSEQKLFASCCNESKKCSNQKKKYRIDDTAVSALFMSYSKDYSVFTSQMTCQLENHSLWYVNNYVLFAMCMKELKTLFSLHKHMALQKYYSDTVWRLNFFYV